MTDHSTTEDAVSPVDATVTARKLWLRAACQSDLDEVERLYRWALSSKTNISNDDEPPKKKNRKSGDCGLNRTQFTQAGEKLALLLCQSGRCKKAKRGLASMGFTCRLARQVLDYPYKKENDSSGSNGDNEMKQAEGSYICQVVDGFLSQHELERLRLVFASPTANYWTDHSYSVEPPSPYFSYVLPLAEIKSSEKEGKRPFIYHIIQKIISCPILQEKYPKLQDKAKFVEFWAHNRPHASGHQMVSYITCNMKKKNTVYT